MRTHEYATGASPRERGRTHGESFRAEIAELCEIRIHLTIENGRVNRRDDVLALAERHLPVLADFDADLDEELRGIAEGANLTPAHVVVLNHYTDLRDLGGEGPAGLEGDGCSVLFARTPEGPVVAQTWDTHATAIPYVMMLRAPEGWLLSVTGCLGMAGLSTAGVAVAINNLQSTDARVGVVWSALVRRALAAGSAEVARDLILSAPIGSGRHYLLADRVGAFGVEASGTRRDLVYRGDEPAYVHTNHCFSDEVGACSRIAPGSTTLDRHAALCMSLESRPVASARDAFARLGSHEGYPRSVCANLSTPQRPHGVATCAAIAMNLASGELLAVAGFPHNVEPDRFSTRP